MKKKFRKYISKPLEIRMKIFSHWINIGRVVIWTISGLGGLIVYFSFNEKYQNPTPITVNKEYILFEEESLGSPNNLFTLRMKYHDEPNNNSYFILRLHSRFNESLKKQIVIPEEAFRFNVGKSTIVIQVLNVDFNKKNLTISYQLNS